MRLQAQSGAFVPEPICDQSRRYAEVSLINTQLQLGGSAWRDARNRFNGFSAMISSKRLMAWLRWGERPREPVKGVAQIPNTSPKNLVLRRKKLDVKKHYKKPSLSAIIWMISNPML
jgi:hypothetical protein